MKYFKTILVIGLLFLLSSTGWASVPSLMNFQGILTDTIGNPLSGTFSVEFRIYNALVGGTSYWNETQSVTTDASGLFNVTLGVNSALVDSVFADTIRYLGAKVGVNPELAPRTRLVSVGYSQRVGTVDGATGGVISGDVEIQSKLIVDRVGIGTTSPEVMLHISYAGISEGIKITNTSPGGVSSSIINSGVGSAYGGKKFIIEHNLFNALTIDSNANVGIGTTSPERKLHIIEPSLHGGLRLEGGPDGPNIEWKTGSSRHWNIDQAGPTTDLRFFTEDATDGAGIDRVRITESGNVGIGISGSTHPLHMASGAHVTAEGTWTNASSKQLKTDIEPLQNEEYSEILEKLEKLDVVRFKYKVDPEREHIGLIAEDVPEEIASDDRTGIPTADAIGFLMAALKAQQYQIQQLQETLNQLKKEK